MDYNTTSATPELYTPVISGSVAVAILLVMFALLLVLIVAGWKIYTKAGQQGWKSIIPIYNIVVMLEIVGKPTWWLVLMFIPFVNFIVGCLVNIELAKVFGKGVGYGIGMILVPMIFWPMLAFGSAEYKKPVVSQ